MSQKRQQHLNSQTPFVLWFTGFSGAGKSTIANAIAQRITQLGGSVHLLDGDVVRKGLCVDLTFTDTDRDENIRRVSEVAKLVLDSGAIVIAALISPKQAHRQLARDTFKEGEFIEVFIDTSFDECERRDVKGLYKKARDGVIKNFTGIDSEYEIPSEPEIHVKTEHKTLTKCVSQVFDYLFVNGYLQDTTPKK